MSAEIKWKGTTFTQLSSGLRFNNPAFSNNHFGARPLKIYRREIASVDVPNCKSQRLEDFVIPGGTVRTSQTTGGIVSTTEYVNRDSPCVSANCSVIQSPAANARRRVRSSGMIQNKDKYCTNNSQYLSSRSLSFSQNQYFHVQTGSSTVKPGSALATKNIYSSNGANTCPKYYIAADTNFSYLWIDGSSNTVDVSAGYYNIDDFNGLLYFKMITNNHYFIEKVNMTKVMVFKFVYDNDANRIQIQSQAVNSTTFAPVNYDKPGSVLWNVPTSTTDASNVSIVISNSHIPAGLGFAAGTWPVSQTSTPAANKFINGTQIPGLRPNYAPVYYKPSNSQFGVQGAVSSSDRILRKKYDTITTVGSSFRTAYGAQTADALAYGVSDYGYTIKDKIGVEAKKIPKFSQYSNIMKVCSSRRIS
jgi:hypothetical protein